MSRSAWKGPYINEELSKNFQNHSGIVVTTARSSEIISNFVGFIFEIHTGKTFFKLEIAEEMIGYKLGEFAFTRAKYEYKRRKKRKKMKKKLKKKA